MTEQGEWREVRIGNSLVPVRRDSVLDVVFGDEEEPPAARRMQWSLGVLADLLWLLLPESRSALIGLVHGELDEAAEYDRELQWLRTFPVAREAFWEPLFEPALREFPASRSTVGRYCEFVRVAWKLEDRDRDALREVLADVVLDELTGSPYEAIIESVDPELYALVNNRSR